MPRTTSYRGVEQPHPQPVDPNPQLICNDPQLSCNDSQPPKSSPRSACSDPQPPCSSPQSSCSDPQLPESSPQPPCNDPQPAKTYPQSPCSDPQRVLQREIPFWSVERSGVEHSSKRLNRGLLDPVRMGERRASSVDAFPLPNTILRKRVLRRGVLGNCKLAILGRTGAFPKNREGDTRIESVFIHRTSERF